MRHETVKVIRDNQTTHSKTVAPWEIVLLEYIFDEGNVTRTGQYVDVPGRDYPDPAGEMARLQAAYGKDVKTDIPFAVTVYGAARVGVRALARAIQEAQDAEEEAQPKAAKRPRVNPADRLTAASLLN